MNNLDQKIEEFSNYILKTPEFIRLQKAIENLESNEDASSILQNAQEQMQTVGVLQQNGLPVSDKQRQELIMAQNKMRGNEICMEYLKAENLAIVMARKICNDLTVSTGILFAGGGSCCG